MRLLLELLHRFYCLTQRVRVLHWLSLRLVEIYAKYSKIWWYERPNYLGRVYICRRIPSGVSWYMFEKYGVKWGRTK